MFTIKILMVLPLELLRDTVIENKWAHRVSQRVFARRNGPSWDAHRDENENPDDGGETIPA
jgi:hypothetical protein